MNFYTHAAQGGIWGCIFEVFYSNPRLLFPRLSVPAAGGMARAPPGAQRAELFAAHLREAEPLTRVFL